ncbi:hypothetical protein ACQKFW_21180, partial [Bacillus subtilis]
RRCRAVFCRRFKTFIVQSRTYTVPLKQRQELLTSFEAHVPASEGKLLSRIKSETMVDRFYFNEENEQYDISGYVQEEQSIIGELKKYM